MRSKYHSHKSQKDGMSFDSRLEAKRWAFLSDLSQLGIISNLRRQVKYEVVPKSVELVMKPLKTKIKYEERVVERAVHYIADFVYLKDGTEVIEDTKGVRTQDYIIKRKLMLRLGHPVREITKFNEDV